MASGDDDDPIIEEIDVYLAKSLADKLYLFQYPVRPSTMTYDDVNHLAAKIKPKQKKVELEMAINTMSPNYCSSKGEQIALNVDGTVFDETNTYSTKRMDKQSFSSIQATTNTSRYAAAVFRKGELHVTPLTGILQMRPSFSYLDKADNKTREREAANEGGDSSQDEAEEEAKSITVRFARPESEQARQRRIQSYEFLQKKQAEEPWVHLHYHSSKDGRSEHERQYLFCQSVDTSENSEMVKTPKEYLAMLMPPLAEEKLVKPVGPSNVLSMAQLRTLPLGEQVKTLLKNVKVMPFANLMGLLASGSDSTSVLRCIQQVALLVQGNWVVKSDVLYPKNTCSPHSSVPAEVLCRGRDFVMWRFTLERSVMRKEIASIIKLPPEDVKEFLEHVAVPRVNRGWEFLLPTDVDFIKKHQDVAHRQQMLWLGIQSKLEKVFNFSKEDFMPKNSPQPEPVHVTGEQRLKMAQERAQENQSSLQADLSAKRTGSRDHIQDVKPPNNVPSMAQLCTLPLGEQVKTLLKNVKVMPFANLMGLLASGTDSTSVLRCLQQVALLVQGNWVVKSDVLYPKSTCSPHSGVPAEVLCRGRDFVMWRFTLERSVMMEEIASVIKLPPEDVKEFLEHVAVPRVNRGWEFLLPTDVDFIKKHQDVAHRQHMLWLGIQSKLEKVFNFTKEDFMPNNSLQPEPVHVSGERERAQEYQSSLQGDLNAKGMGNGGHIKQEPASNRDYEPMDTSPSPSSSIPSGSVNVHPSATSPGFENTNGNTPSPELQDFVIKTFRKHFVLTLNELKRLFNLHLASMPTGWSVFHSVSDHLLQDAVLLCHCKQIMVPFPAQTTAAPDEQKVFGLWETGEDFDKHRRLLYEVFTKNYRIRRNVIQVKLAQEFEGISKADIDRLLKECCISHAGMWYLKGTIQS